MSRTQDRAPILEDELDAISLFQAQPMAHLNRDGHLPLAADCAGWWHSKLLQLVKILFFTLTLYSASCPLHNFSDRKSRHKLEASNLEFWQGGSTRIAVTRATSHFQRLSCLLP
jgi:hypothetical protein